MKLQNLEKPSAAVSDTVDVIADSNYSNVSKAYNHAFRAWRNKEDNPYAFRCKKQKKEAVYIEGKGFHEPDPAAEERRSLIRITMVIGMAIFAYLLIENLLTAILMGIAQIAGMDIGYCYSDGTVYGNQTAVLVILMCKTVLKFLVPVLILRCCFRMPRRVAYHWKLDSPREFPAAIAVTLVFEVLAISICKELLLHGDMLHVLRQFGDWDAVILTAVVAVCLSHSCTTILMELTFSLVSGVAVLRSGSVVPAIFCRLLYHVMLFGLFAMEIWQSSFWQSYCSLFLFLVLIAGILLCLLSIRPARKNPALLTQKHYLTLRERLYTVMHVGPLSIVLILCVILMVIEVIF